MKHNFWIKLASYFVDISLEESSSEFNPYIEVLMVQGRHQLATKDAVYSFDDKYLNFYKTFQRINWNKNKVHKVLVLGLGLGSVVLMLEKNFKKNFDYTAIEIDPEICRLAQKYTLSKLDSFVEVICADALNFLNVNNEKYDLVIMDVFQSALIPQQFQSISFLQLLSGKLSENGILLFNRMNITKQDQQENNTFRNRFNKIFPNMAELMIKDNLIFINHENQID